MLRIKRKISAKSPLASRAKGLLCLLLLLPAMVAAPTTHPNTDINLLPAEWAGVYILELASGYELVAQNADKRFIPASITKALTSASVMCLKDSADRFVTPVIALGDINGQVLNGHIVVSAVGDPTIESKHFPEFMGFCDSIALSVKSLGITRIAGRVIIDQSQFKNDGIPSGWVDEDLVWPYGAELFGANYLENTVTLSMPAKKFTPATPGVQIIYKPSKGNMALKRPRTRHVIEVTGTPAKRGESCAVANPDPAATMQQAIVNALKKKGVAVDGGDVSASMESTLVYAHTSPRFVDILQSMMFRSDNLMAEGMLRTLDPGEGREDAIAEELDIWRDNDVSVAGLVIEDGSGLSRKNRMSPRFLGNVLAWMAESLVAQSYSRLFPRVGREGTVKSFLADTPLENRLALKTGSMKGVQCYAGYMFDEQELPSHVVVVMVNNFTGSRVKLKNNIADMLLRTLPIPAREELDVE